MKYTLYLFKKKTLEYIIWKKNLVKNKKSLITRSTRNYWVLHNNLNGMILQVCIAFSCT